MDCLDNILKLDHTCAAGDGILSLQSIGITERLLAQVTNEDETPQSMLAYIEGRAKEVLRSDVVTFFADRIIPRTMVDRHGIGNPDYNAVLESGGAGERGGIVVELGESNSNQVLIIGAMSVWTDATGPVTIEVHDLTDGRLVQSFDIPAEADEITVTDLQVNLPARRRRTRYFISTQLTSYYKVDLYSEGSCAGCTHYGYLTGGVNIWAARLNAAMPIRRPNLRSVSHTSGITATVTVGCDHGQMLCEIKDRIALPYLYKVGQLIMERSLYAFERLNSQTIDKEALAMRYDRLGEEYSSTMKNVLGKMTLPDDPTCFVCNVRTRTITAIP